MMLQQTLRKLYEPFLSIDCPVYHYYRAEAADKYIVWSETGEETSFNADNHKHEQQLTGVVDFYTLDEFDPIADEIQTVLNGEEVGWRLISVQWEEETGLIHYQWGWWLG